MSKLNKTQASIFLRIPENVLTEVEKLGFFRCDGPGLYEHTSLRGLLSSDTFLLACSKARKKIAGVAAAELEEAKTSDGKRRRAERLEREAKALRTSAKAQDQRAILDAQIEACGVTE